MNPTSPTWPHQNIVILRVHRGAGQWYRQIGGRVIYFGVLRDPDAALRKYLAWANAAAEVAPSAFQRRDAVTLDVGLNHFLHARQIHVGNGDLSADQFMRYRRAVQFVFRHLDRARHVASLQPDDFAKLRGLIKGSPRTVGNAVRDIRVAFRWIHDHYGIAPAYGQAFKRPSARAIRATSKKRELWTPAELRKVLKHAEPNIRAMMLLAINCGFGQTDCARLTLSSIKRDGHSFARPKTGVERRCPFWPETYRAIMKRHRWRPEIEPDLVFLSKYGRPLVRDEAVRDAVGKLVKSRHKDAIGPMFRRACQTAKVRYRSFYSLRHTFRSVADGVPDQTAIRAIMGHTAPGMDGVYVQLMGDGMKRLKAVTNHVHRWLYGH